MDRIDIEGGGVSLRYEGNKCCLYLITDLKKIVIKIRKPPTGHYDLRQMVHTMFHNAGNHWPKWMRVISPSIHMTHIASLAGNFPLTRESGISWDTAFFFGVFFERLRNKLGLEIDWHMYDVTAEEMKEALEQSAIVPIDEDEDDTDD